MSSTLPIEEHPFPPYVPAGARYLLIGTFPGRTLTQPDAKRDLNDWYYGTHSHSLWKILEEIYGRPLPAKQAKQMLLADLKIGITDVVATARRRKPSNNDGDLEVVEFQKERLAELLKNNTFEALFFTSQQAQKWFAKLRGKLLEDFGVLVSQIPAAQHVLPSPSPMYIRFRRGTAEERLAKYRELLPALR